MTEEPTAAGWGNGVTIKRTTSGYSWTVAVASASDELEAMRQAVATAQRVDAELAAHYGPPSRPRIAVDEATGRGTT